MFNYCARGTLITLGTVLTSPAEAYLSKTIEYNISMHLLGSNNQADLLSNFSSVLFQNLYGMRKSKTVQFPVDTSRENHHSERHSSLYCACVPLRRAIEWNNEQMWANGGCKNHGNLRFESDVFSGPPNLSITPALTCAWWWYLNSFLWQPFLLNCGSA